MNRIRPPTPPANTSSLGAKPSGVTGSASIATTSDVSEGILSRAGSEKTPHALFAPLHYERNYAYPLIVWLHGADDNENQLKRIMPLVSLRNYVAIAPRGTAASTDAHPAAFNWQQTGDHIQAAEERVLDCLAAAQAKFHLAAGRVFLAGCDCGGSMALRVAMRQPRRFAGVLSFGGQFPTGDAPLAQLAEARRLSIFVACNRASQRYPTDVVCDDLRLLHSAGMSVVLREYPGTDGLTPRMLSDMDRWLMEQITRAGASAGAAAPSSPAGPR
jgi:phospholipase/carboxylesterase